MIKRAPFFFASLLAVAAASAANPISTLNYAADPSAHVFGDRLYIYPSHDRTDAKEFDMMDYHVYSTDDLVNWTDHGKVIDVADIPWAKSHMWAPDAAFKDGTYYFYFPVRGEEKGSRFVGVATSTSPAGPFTDSGRPIAGVTGIDPSVFIDDDGQGYIVWASKGGPHIAKLKPNLREIDGADMPVVGLENFFEGPWIFKREGTYYLTYPAKMKGGSHDGGHGQWYDYATSKEILGPYTYRDHIDQSGPGGDNIHGSEFEWKGKWYHVYHDFSQSVDKAAQGFKRTIHIDEMSFNPDGSIPRIKWTKEGPAKLKDVAPYTRIEAETTSASDVPEGPHAVTTRGNEKTGVFLCEINNGDWVKISNLDFGAAPGAQNFQARVSAAKAGSEIVLHLDRLDGPVIGRYAVPGTGGFDAWQDVSGPVHGATGLHDLVLEFTGPDGDELLNLDSYQFQR